MALLRCSTRRGNFGLWTLDFGLWTLDFELGDRWMRPNRRHMALLISLTLVSFALADWPQWRGPNRDAKVSDFKVPANWPKELTKKWSVEVGIGDSTPALVGDKV